MVSTRARLLAVALLVALPASIASAQSPADFYKGRTVELYVGYSVGGAYDLYARTIARFLGRHIPGSPTVIVKNMEGGGSLRLANWLFRVAPKDGSVLATIGRGTGFDPILGQAGAQFDGTKFTWLGSANNEVSVCVSWNATSGISKFEDLFTKEITVGGTSMSADTDQFPKVIDGVFGAKMRIVSGYPGGNNVVLAMERGEIQGRCGWSWSSIMSTHKAWIDEKKITVLVQIALRKHAELPNVPLIMDFAKTDEQKQILKLIFARQTMGRPYLAPPGIPADRAAALRQAFMDTMADNDFLAEAEKEKLEITPVDGADLQNLVAEVYATPAEIEKKAAALLNGQ
jgi:tripartite-type tricarboxylate transporter receptor subunit TctC